jgi:hypothetical protein
LAAEGLDPSAWESALSLNRESLAAWLALDAKAAAAQTHLKISRIYARRGMRDLARSEDRLAKALCQDLRCRAEAANNIGVSARNLMDFEEAENELFRGRRLG